MDREPTKADIVDGGFIQWLVRATFGCRSRMPLFTTGNCGIFELLVVPTDGGRPAYLQWRLVNFQSAGLVTAIAPVFLIFLASPSIVPPA